MTDDARLVAVLARHAAERPAQLACADRRWTFDWSELAVAVDAAARSLRAQGLQPGDRVALCAKDGVPALVAALAVLQAGGVHVPVDQQLAAPERAALLADLAVPWLLALEDESAPGALALAATGEARSADPLGAGASAFLRCSSGTTGAAKGVLLSHRSIIERCDAANAALGLGPGDRVLWLLPMSYHFAVSICAYLRFGAGIVFGAALRAADSAAMARAHGCTMIYASPWHLRRLAALGPADELPASLRQVVATTAALDRDAAAAFRARHGLGVRQGLGIIEVGLPFVSPGAEGEAPGELGRPLPAYDVAVLDGDGRALPPGEIGELAIGGPGLADAYLRPWRPRAQFLHQGRFRTGDQVRVDEAGRVTLLGRLKELINVGGVKVFPLEVEAVLGAHPRVSACRVRGEADVRSGERVVAELSVDGADEALEAALRAWCAARLAPLKRPSRYVFTSLELTGSGKVKRGGEQAAEQPAGG